MNQTSQSTQGGANGWADIVGGITEGLSKSYFVTLRETKMLYCLHFYSYRGIKYSISYIATFTET
jgi:hypothetical protein